MRRAWRASRAGWITAAWIAAAGCAGAPVSAPVTGYPSDASSADTGAAEGPDDAAEGRAEIEHLTRQIQASQAQAGNVGDAGELKSAPAPQEPPGAAQGRCVLACDVARGICGSSERICAIAGQLAQEPDLAERCAWSQQACEESQTRCTTCSP